MSLYSCTALRLLTTPGQGAPDRRYLLGHPVAYAKTQPPTSMESLARPRGCCAALHPAPQLQPQLMPHCSCSVVALLLLECGMELSLHWLQQAMGGGEGRGGGIVMQRLQCTCYRLA
jgi:hypothetical protein